MTDDTNPTPETAPKSTVPLPPDADTSQGADPVTVATDAGGMVRVTDTRNGGTLVMEADGMVRVTDTRNGGTLVMEADGSSVTFTNNGPIQPAALRACIDHKEVWNALAGLANG